MKYELTFLEETFPFQDFLDDFRKLQKQTREILNKTIQIAYNWDFRSQNAKEESGTILDICSETGYKRLDGYIYNCLKDQYSDMASSNLNATIQKAYTKYRTDKSDIVSGKISIPSYKKDQPLILHKSTVKLRENEKSLVVNITLFSRIFSKNTNRPFKIGFMIKKCDHSQRLVWNRIQSGEYQLNQCQLIYEKSKFNLLLTYSFYAKEIVLDPEKILGVDLGETYAVYASSQGQKGSFKIEGQEVTAYARQLENRRRSLQKQAAYCGEGRIGHGVKTRVSKVYQAKDRIANFRDTINHRYSRALVAYAVKNGYGTIQMEDLSHIKERTGFPKQLQHWTYYDLQSKIESKAKEYGIHVVKIKPLYTSLRCSRCGCIDKKNRLSQSQFRCVACGFSCNADWNASQNISIKGIEQIIIDTIGAKENKTEKSE